MSALAGRIPTAPKTAMKPASDCEQPIVGQSQSCVPCLSPCSAQTGALWCRGQSFIPACSEPESHENAVADSGNHDHMPREGNRGNETRATSCRRH